MQFFYIIRIVLYQQLFHLVLGWSSSWFATLYNSGRRWYWIGIWLLRKSSVSNGHSKLLNKMGHYFLVTQYTQAWISSLIYDYKLYISIFARFSRRNLIKILNNYMLWTGKFWCPKFVDYVLNSRIFRPIFAENLHLRKIDKH